jgi:ribosomal protein S20
MDQHGTAHLTNQMVALAARTNQMEALEARTQTDLLQLEENQSQLAHAYKIIHTNHEKKIIAKKYYDHHLAFVLP